MLSRKYYRVIAQMLNKNDNWENEKLNNHFVDDLIDFMQRDNPRFNINKFVRASGLSRKGKSKYAVNVSKL